MSFIDIIAAVAIIFGFVRGWTNGFIKEIAGLVGVILGIWAGFSLAWLFADYYRENFDLPENIIPFVAFITAFILVLIAILFIGRLLRKVLEKAALSGFDKLAGGLFGALKLAFLIGTLLGLVGKFNLLPSETKKDSVSYPYLVGYCEVVTDYTIGLIPQVKNSFKDLDGYVDDLREKRGEPPLEDNPESETPAPGSPEGDPATPETSS